MNNTNEIFRFLFCNVFLMIYIIYHKKVNNKLKVLFCILNILFLIIMIFDNILISQSISIKTYEIVSSIISVIYFILVIYISILIGIKRFKTIIYGTCDDVVPKYEKCYNRYIELLEKNSSSIDEFKFRSINRTNVALHDFFINHSYKNDEIKYVLLTSHSYPNLNVVIWSYVHSLELELEKSKVCERKLVKLSKLRNSKPYFINIINNYNTDNEVVNKVLTNLKSIILNKN